MADDGNTTDAPVQPAHEPQTEPAPTPTTAAPTEDAFVQVPKDQMGDYGTDFHNLLGDAKTGREFNAEGGGDLMRELRKANITPAQLAEHFRSEEAVPAATGQDGLGEATPTEPLEPPLTLAAIREDRQRDRQREREEDADRYDLQVAEQTAQNFNMQALRDMNLPMPANAGDPINSLTQAGWDALQNFTEQVQAGQVDQYATAEQREAAMNQPPTLSMLQEAQRLATTYMADLRNEFNSAAATGQFNIPEATHGDGPAGQPAAKDVNDMTPEEYQATIIERANAKLAAQGQPQIGSE